jgi:hypothetical protein
LDPSLAKVRTYWEGLKRGNADIPFADDAKLSHLGGLSNNAFLIACFAHPERFRFDIVGPQVMGAYGADLVGRFVDEIPHRPPFDDFLLQCRVTLDTSAPSYYRHAPADVLYERILLPLWGDGHISALLGATKP